MTKKTTQSVTTATPAPRPATGKVNPLVYYQLLDEILQWMERKNLPLPVSIPTSEVDQSHFVEA